MLKRMIRYLRGYLQVFFTGVSNERFLNLCRNHGIVIWKLAKAEGGSTAYISLQDYRRLKPIIKKTHTFPYIRQKIGLPFLIFKYRKRKMFFISLLWFYALLYILSMFVWRIDFSGQERYTEETLSRFLAKKNIVGGMLCRDVHGKEIEDAIRKEYPDIGWVSVELDGTRLFVQILENVVPLVEEEQKKAKHLVADRSGKVVSIVTRQGKPMVHAGDTVKKGDILISGVVDIVGDGDTVLRKQPVYADGDVVIRSKVKYDKSFSMAYDKRVPTGRKLTVYGLSYKDSSFCVYNPLKKFETYEKYDIITCGDSFQMNPSFPLPVSWWTKSYEEIVVKRQVYSPDEAKQKARRRLEEDMNEWMEAGAAIRKENVQITISNATCSAHGNIVIEKCADTHKKIKKDEWRIKQTDEFDGNDN